MKLSKISAVLSVLAIVSALAIPAGAETLEQDLTPTDAIRKFDLGSKEVGGSGVEPEGSDDGKNWIKVVQSSNADLKLFEDIGPDVNVTALEVTFEISEWSGTEYSISWGANIDFFNDASTTWCGTDAFSGISEYKITGDGEYTVTCDLAALVAAQGKEGISHLQTCEMVIDHVADGDTTQIEVKSAKIYYEKAADESQSSSQTDSSASDSVSDSSSSSSKAESSTSSASAISSSLSKSGTSGGRTTTTKTASTAAVSSTAADNSNSDTGAAAGIALAGIALASAAAVVSKRK